MEIYKKLKKPKKSIVFSTYWKFATERQNVFFNKIAKKSILTDNPILKQYKFTNAYRASDRVSQYLIRNVIYSPNNNFSEPDILFRILLFKIFNKISTWEVLESEFGQICIDTFNFQRYSKLLNIIKGLNRAIYSGAYIMTSGKSIFGFERKHENHLKLLEQYFVKSSLYDQIKNTKSLEDVYNIILGIPTFGQFLAFQYTIDINYSKIINFSEMDFVIAGPGAKDGIKKCFTDLGDYSFEDIIKYMAENQEKYFNQYDLEFKNLWGRPLQLIDCQNLFCEVDKYSRVKHPEILGFSGRTRIKQIYRPSRENIEYFFPPKWRLNVKM